MIGVEPGEPDRSKRLAGLYSPYFMMGTALHGDGLYRQALIHLDEALGLNRDSPAAWYFRGYTLLALGREQEALAAFDRVEELDPDNERAMADVAAVRRQFQAPPLADDQ
ncbi:MAG: tetratricopeptide repeat protein [Gammaproteobacteria bacterium]|nr:tetratricopeptide repeat protein [Gammaproteobacteria bacterium]